MRGHYLRGISSTSVPEHEIEYEAHSEVEVCPHCGEFIGFKEWIIDKDSGWNPLVRSLDFDALAKEVMNIIPREGDTVTVHGYVYVGECE